MTCRDMKDIKIVETAHRMSNLKCLRGGFDDHKINKRKKSNPSFTYALALQILYGVFLKPVPYNVVSVIYAPAYGDVVVFNCRGDNYGLV